MPNSRCIKLSDETFNLLKEKEKKIKKDSPNYFNITHDYTIRKALENLK